MNVGGLTISGSYGYDSSNGLDMVTKQKETTTSITLVRILLRYITQSGLNANELLGPLDIGFSMVEDTEARISSHQFAAIWQAALKQSKDPDFGLHFGKALADSYTGGHILFNVMKNCPTVGTALEKFCIYHDLMADAIQPVMKLGPPYVSMTWDIDGPEVSIPRHLSEALLTSYVFILRQVSDNRLNLLETRFQHPQPRNINEHERIFEAPLLFGQGRNELIFDRKYLELPVFLADGEFLETLESYAQKVLDRLYPPNSWSEKVIRLQNELFVRGDKPNIEAVARSLAVSSRKLQIKLKEEGTTYQNILDQVREALALNYLGKEEITICDIAFLLGYSEQSAFNHAFKRWTGSTPGEYLKRERRKIP